MCAMPIFVVGLTISSLCAAELCSCASLRCLAIRVVVPSQSICPTFEASESRMLRLFQGSQSVLSNRILHFDLVCYLRRWSQGHAHIECACRVATCSRTPSLTWFCETSMLWLVGTRRARAEKPFELHRRSSRAASSC
jgi:hypothetical protein